MIQPKSDESGYQIIRGKPRWVHNGKALDIMGTEIKKGDRIIKRRDSRYNYYYVLEVQETHMICCLLKNFRHPKYKFKMCRPRKHTNIRPDFLFIDHEWRKNHVK